MLFVQFSRSAGASFLLACLFAGALVTSRADATPTIYGTYYDDTPVENGCFNQTYCQFYFSQLPSNKLVLVRKILCSLTTSSRPVGVYFLVAQGSNGSNTLARRLSLPVLAPVVQSNGYFLTSVDVDPRFLIGQSRYPYLQISTETTSGTLYGSCSLSGDLIDPIQ